MKRTNAIAYLDGKLIPVSKARIEIYDAGIVMGATVTDMTRTFGHEPFRLQDHVERLYRSCRYARIDPPISMEKTMKVSMDIVKHNCSLLKKDEDLALAHFMTAGKLRMYAGGAGPVDTKPTYCIHTFRLPFKLWKKALEEGFHVVTPSIRHVPPQCVDPKIKCRSRMHFWLADKEAKLVDPAAVALCLDLDGNVTETPGANFLICKNGAVISPPPRHILRGISLTTVSEICSSLRIPFVERELQVYDVVNADEALLTTTPYCLAPVTRINGIRIGNGRPGALHGKIISEWSKLVGVDILRQIRQG